MSSRGLGGRNPNMGHQKALLKCFLPGIVEAELGEAVYGVYLSPGCTHHVFNKDSRKKRLRGSLRLTAAHQSSKPLQGMLSCNLSVPVYSANLSLCNLPDWIKLKFCTKLVENSSGSQASKGFRCLLVSESRTRHLELNATCLLAKWGEVFWSLNLHSAIVVLSMSLSWRVCRCCVGLILTSSVSTPWLGLFFLMLV